MNVLSSKALAALSVLCLSGIASAFGGFGVSVTLPKAGDTGTKGAVLIVQPIGCHGPGASVSARAVGVVEGKRRSIPLALVPVSGQTDTYMLKKTWPSQGPWVIVFLAKRDGLNAESLVQIGRDGLPVVTDRPASKNWDDAVVLSDKKTKLLPWTFTNDDKVVAMSLVNGNVDTAVDYMLRASRRH
jgi:hypothetical protein